MKRRIIFTVSAPSRETHPNLIADQVLTAAGVVGYRLTSAKRYEIYEDLVQITVVSTFDTKSDEDLMKIRLFFRDTLRGSLSEKIRFVCVDSVSTVSESTR